MSEPLQYLAVTLIMTGGALVQGLIGFGLGLLAVPFLVLLDPTLVPGPILFASGVLSILMLIRERHAIRRRNLAWSLVGRVGGTALAAVVLLIVPGDRLGLLFGFLILVGTGLTASGLHIVMNPATLTGAGFASGFMATTVSIGGPPMALLYHRQDGPILRGTLSAFFVVGTVISLTALHFVDRFAWRELVLGVGLFPGIILGFAISTQLTRRIDGRMLRPAILGVCAITGLVVLIEAIRAY
ncbi:MAG: sulfite exporter TauE/SafE family protein [Gemmatimonadota bacterium]|nr:sulfite exporter TauE/SafE family protein [Gemmatimonadota bacterium]